MQRRSIYTPYKRQQSFYEREITKWLAFIKGAAGWEWETFIPRACSFKNNLLFTPSKLTHQKWSYQTFSLEGHHFHRESNPLYFSRVSVWRHGKNTLRASSAPFNGRDMERSMPQYVMCNFTWYYSKFSAKLLNVFTTYWLLHHKAYMDTKF